MTEREQAAYHAGLRQAADMALIAALALELREDGTEIRQRAAIEALRGLAEGLKAQSRPTAPAPAVVALIAVIAREPGTMGTASCPECSGRLRWIKDASNGHIHAECEATGCLTVMQ